MSEGHGKTPKDAASVRATHPIPAACGVYYFEVKIISKGRDGWGCDALLITLQAVLVALFKGCQCLFIPDVSNYVTQLFCLQLILSSFLVQMTKLVWICYMTNVSMLKMLNVCVLACFPANMLILTCYTSECKHVALNIITKKLLTCGIMSCFSHSGGFLKAETYMSILTEVTSCRV